MGNEEKNIETRNDKRSVKKRKRKKKGNRAAKIIIAVLFCISIIVGNRAAAMKWEFHKTFEMANFDNSAVINTVNEEALAAGTDTLQSDDIINLLLVKNKISDKRIINKFL